MSEVRNDLITDKKRVMAFAVALAKKKKYVNSIYLTGSRAKSGRVQDGKDWDFIFVTDFPVVGMGHMAKEEGIHADIMTMQEDDLSSIRNKKMVWSRDGVITRGKKWLLSSISLNAILHVLEIGAIIYLLLK